LANYMFPMSGNSKMLPITPHKATISDIKMAAISNG